MLLMTSFKYVKAAQEHQDISPFASTLRNTWLLCMGSVVAQFFDNLPPTVLLCTAMYWCDDAPFSQPFLRKRKHSVTLKCFLHSSFLLLSGLWEASRRAVEPGWIHDLPASLQHGALPRVSARLPSLYFLASAPLCAAPTQRAHLLQHQLPRRPWPPSPIHVPQGAIRVTRQVQLLALREATWWCHGCFMGIEASLKTCASIPTLLLFVLK